MKADAELKAWCLVLSQPKEVAETVPKGWLSIRQLCEASGVHRSALNERVRCLLAQNKAEVKKFRIMTPRGIYPVPHWKLK